MRLLVVKSPSFSKCDRVREVVRRFDGVVILCGDLSQCYELLQDVKGRRVVGTPSLYSDVFEIKMLKSLGALCMGRWIDVGEAVVGCIDALNPVQCLEMLARASKAGEPRILVSTQRLRTPRKAGWPSAEELCSLLGTFTVIDCCGEQGVAIYRLPRCTIVEVGCSLALIEMMGGEVKAVCVEI